jgi:hypothetical protein
MPLFCAVAVSCLASFLMCVRPCALRPPVSCVLSVPTCSFDCLGCSGHTTANRLLCRGNRAGNGGCVSMEPGTTLWLRNCSLSDNVVVPNRGLHGDLSEGSGGGGDAADPPVQPCADWRNDHAWSPPQVTLRPDLTLLASCLTSLGFVCAARPSAVFMLMSRCPRLLAAPLCAAAPPSQRTSSRASSATRFW